MSPLRRVLLAGVPGPPTARPHHGCVAGLWIWVLAAVAVSIVGLAVGACCARL